jgi:hypothetical protein
MVLLSVVKVFVANGGLNEESVCKTGGLISGPNTYAEFNHNTRLLQQFAGLVAQIA